MAHSAYGLKQPAKECGPLMYITDFDVLLRSVGAPALDSEPVQGRDSHGSGEGAVAAASCAPFTEIHSQLEGCTPGLVVEPDHRRCPLQRWAVHSSLHCQRAAWVESQQAAHCRFNRSA